MFVVVSARYCEASRLCLCPSPLNAASCSIIGPRWLSSEPFLSAPVAVIPSVSRAQARETVVQGQVPRSICAGVGVWNGNGKGERLDNAWYCSAPASSGSRSCRNSKCQSSKNARTGPRGRANVVACAGT